MTSVTATQPHPWNTDFTWVDRTGPLRRLSEDQVQQFDQRGFVVLPRVFAEDVLAPVRAELDALEREKAAIDADALTFTYHVVRTAPAARAFSRDPVFTDLCHDLVGPDVRLYWDQAVYKKPETPRRFPWHQDNGYTYVEPQQYLTCWVALTDATLDNGCPQVAPGIHRQGTLTHWLIDGLGWECLSDPSDTVAAEVEAGGVVVFSSLTPHLTGPNLTDGVRKAYILQYAPDGAEILLGDPTAGPPTERMACQDPSRQYLVLRDGERVGDD